MKKFVLPTVLSLCSTLSACNLHDSSDTNSVEKCSYLLPKGHKYQIDIDTTFDYLNASSQLHGGLKIIKDNKDIVDLESYDYHDFTFCVLPLISGDKI